LGDAQRGAEGYMNISANDIVVFIDPSYSVFYDNEMFNPTSRWNRDRQFAPFIFLREKLAKQGISVNTADYLLDHRMSGRLNVYVSLGIIDNYRKLAEQENVRLQSFYILEPPVVAPYLYGEIDSLTRHFDRVYVHNTEGVGYEKHFSHQSNLRKFFWPQVENGVIEHLWNNKDRGFLTMISSNKATLPYLQVSRGQNPIGFKISLNKNPGLKHSELYSERIRALATLQGLGTVDLYGYGWDISLYQILRNMPYNQRFPYMYWKNRKALRAIYKGAVKSKYETLSRYRFALCFENMAMLGYITEKIFDCFFVGTIPIYLGAPDVENYIPKSCFIDMRDFDNYAELHSYLSNLSDEDISSFRMAAREYLSSAEYQPFTKEKFVEQFEVDLMETLKGNGVNLLGLRVPNNSTKERSEVE
jgi:alpha(1,3/1,4) fucosyltransferase